MTLRTIIADDEPLARDLMAAILAEMDGIEVIGQCGSGPDTLAQVETLKPDLLFLDIEMPELTGMEVAATLMDQLPTELIPQIVFTTAYDSYALEAFRVNAVDYLLKPIDETAVVEAVARVRRNLRHAETPSSRDRMAVAITSGRIRLKDSGRVILMDKDEIVSLKAQGDYVSVQTRVGARLIRATLSALETDLPAADFIRVHRSHIIRLGALQEMRAAARGAGVARMISGMDIPVSRSHRPALEHRLGL